MREKDMPANGENAEAAADSLGPASLGGGGLSPRQAREIAYHRHHAQAVAHDFDAVDYAVIAEPRRRWWNAYWDLWSWLREMPLSGQTVLVAGCGGGTDALLFARLGAKVSAFDLSAEMLALGERAAAKEGLAIAFARMAAEALAYPSASFDIVFARDILHHVDIPAAMAEIARVAKPGALLVVDEIYSHSLTEWVRRAPLVERFLYPRLKRHLYAGRAAYITEDERKMDERDIALVRGHLERVSRLRYFNFVVTRLISDGHRAPAMLDRLLLMAMGPLGHYCAGRIVLAGRLKQSPVTP